MTLKFVLCADDFALTDGVSRGIVSLLEKGRLTATGAMTNRHGWRIWARELRQFEARADLGLHLNLTLGRPLGSMPRFAPDGVFPSLGKALMLVLARSSLREEIRDEIYRQIDSFAQYMGREPDFIDGHQHVHAAPGVREALLESISRYRLKGRPYLRDPFDAIRAVRRNGPAVAKALTVSGLAYGFRAAAAARGYTTNCGFAGFSNFDAAIDYRNAFATYLRRPGPKHLVMCHPGELDEELRGLDPVVESRPREMAFFASGDFDDVINQASASLSRFAYLQSVTP